MIKMNRYVKRQDLCLYIFWSALMVCKGFAFRSDDKQAQIVVMLVLPFVILKILFSHWNRQELIRSVCLGCLGIAIWFCTGKTDTLVILITIIACKDVDIYVLFKIGLWIRGLFLVSKISLALLGFIDMQQSYDRRGLGGMRSALGYGHPNLAHYELFIVVALLILIWYEHMRVFHYLFLCASNLFLFHYTHSRTGLVMTFFVIFMTYVVRRKKSGILKCIVASYGQFAYLVCAVFSILICLLLKWLPLFRSFGTFSSRFIDAQRVLFNTSLSLFGKQIRDLDLGPINMLIGRGMVFFILFLYLMTTLLKLFSRRAMYVEEVIGISYAIYSLMETSTNTVMMNVMLLFLTWICFPNTRSKQLITDAEDT